MSAQETERWRRKAKRWRWLALALLVAGIAALAWMAAAGGGQREHVARISIAGFITGSQQQIDLIERARKAKNAKAIIVRINSPGGTTAGAEAIYRALRRAAKEKPVVAVMDTVAASGGYVVALAADRIFAQGNTLTGSIGVIVQWPEAHELLQRLGVQMQAVRSGPLKARPNTFEPTTAEARAWTEKVVRESHGWFVDLLAERRNLLPRKAQELADGRIFSGRMALQEKLVDALGDEHDARVWLKEQHGISTDLPVIAYEPRKSLLQRLGVNVQADSWLRQLGIGAHLDGLISVWHP